MNPIFGEASRLLSGGWVMGLVTAIFFMSFVGWTWWAWRPKNRDHFDRVAKMPFDDEPSPEDLPSNPPGGRLAPRGGAA